MAGTATARRVVGGGGDPGRGAGGDFIVGERAGARGENIRVRGEVGPGAQREHVPLLPAGFKERGPPALLF